MVETARAEIGRETDKAGKYLTFGLAA
ncbi:hypothetical protein LCGC14_2104130, partial [marine sediment metagenome]